MNELTDLYVRLDAKEAEIWAFVANQLGYDVSNEEHRERLEDEVEDLIEEFEAALMEGETVEEWQAQESRRKATAIGRLMLERQEIAEWIVDAEASPKLQRPKDKS
jgi:hypothetical protein